VNSLRAYEWRAGEPSANAGVFAVALGLAQRIRLFYCTVTDTASITQPNGSTAEAVIHHADRPVIVVPTLAQVVLGASPRVLSEV